MRGALVLAVALVAGCAPGSRTAMSTLPGTYRFTTLNGHVVPVEFPAGSGARLERGSLALQSDGRFSLRFASRLAQSAEARSSGEDGAYRAGRDTLYFSPDGREGRPPVWFRYAVVKDGLRLTDRDGNVWTDVRQE